jgi:hypothetical protein
LERSIKSLDDVNNQAEVDMELRLMVKLWEPRRCKAQIKATALIREMCRRTDNGESRGASRAVEAVQVTGATGFSGNNGWKVILLKPSQLTDCSG